MAKYEYAQLSQLNGKFSLDAFRPDIERVNRDLRKETNAIKVLNALADSGWELHCHAVASNTLMGNTTNWDHFYTLRREIE